MFNFFTRRTNRLYTGSSRKLTSSTVLSRIKYSRRVKHCLKSFLDKLPKGSSSKLYILSTATLTSITKISVSTNDHRDAVFIRNGSKMIASVQGTNRLAFYNVTSPR